MPAAIFDLASFSFQVPNCASVLAKHTEAAANRNVTVTAHVFVFILPPMRTNCLADLPPRIIVLWEGLCNRNSSARVKREGHDLQSCRCRQNPSGFSR